MPFMCLMVNGTTSHPQIQMDFENDFEVDH